MAQSGQKTHGASLSFHQGQGTLFPSEYNEPMEDWKKLSCVMITLS